MAETRDIGRFFVHTTNLTRGAPLLHTGHTHETTAPYRTSRSYIVRLTPLRKAVVIGWWRGTGRSEDEQGYGALPEIGHVNGGLDLQAPAVRHAIRDSVAKRSTDIEDEWMILSALGMED
jgi:hypothetical protein